jgi:allophanate hydrolase
VPAAFNELVGLKPTRGLLSTRGVVPACRTLDCVSIFARDVADAGEVLEVAAAYDREDPYSRRAPQTSAGPPLRRASASAGASPRAPVDASFPGRPLVLGLPSPASLRPFGDAASQRAWLRARERTEALADEVIEVDLEPLLEAATLLYDGPWLAERHAAVGAFLERGDVSADPTVRAVIGGGARFTAVDAFAGQYRLAALHRHAEEVFAPLDALVVPTAPTFPTHAEVAAEPVAANARLGTYTNFVNLLDLAAIAVPAARRDDGLPFGVTFVAPAFADGALLALAAAWAGDRSHPDGALRSPASAAPTAPTIDIAVAGAHLTGMARNGDLLALGAQLVRITRTAPRYRLYDLADGTGRPGLLRAGSGEEGEHIEVEVWRLDHAAMGAFLATVAAPLAIGSLELEDGAVVHGFLCEAHAVAGAQDVSEYGGWRAYTAAAAVPA